MTHRVVHTLTHALLVAGICIASGSADAARVRCNLDVDGNGVVDALTDGLLIARAANGVRGARLVRDALGAGATRTRPEDILEYITANQETYDVDGDGVLDGPSDGVMLMRWLFGLEGEAVTENAVHANSLRKNWNAVRAHLEGRCS